MSTRAVLQHCKDKNVGISALEELPAGGVRLVCSSGDGAEVIRGALKAKLINGDVVRAKYRPSRPLW
jgi:hypothetical protein